MLSDLWYRMRALFRRRAVEGELDEELRFHFEQQVGKLTLAGMTRSEAVRQCRLAFGGMGQVKEDCRDARGLASLETLAQDVRHAMRLWRKHSGVALAAAAAIALGIGVNASVFTIVNASLFKRLAYEKNRDILYVLGSTPGCELPCDTGRSYPDFLEFRSQAKSFQALVAYSFARVNLSGDSSFPERYFAMRISANGFTAFGQKPIAGRDFHAADERPGAAPVAMLTYGLWQSRYGKDPHIVGKTIRINGVPTEVIGVMPPEMQFRVNVDLWIPLVPDGEWRTRAHRGAMILGVLAKGATTRSARAELEAISRRLEASFPDTNKGIGVLLLEGSDYFYPRMKLIFFALWIAAGFVLLVACANVANLLLGRAVARSREISIRVALGAGRGRVIRQLLVESVILSAAGGLGGWLLAFWGARAFAATIAGTGVPAWLDFSMDYTVLVYLTAVSVGAGILSGLAPALRLSSVDIHGALKEGGPGASGGSRRRSLSGLLVGGQMAITVLLLVGAVLMVQTLLAAYRSQIGVNPVSILTMKMDLMDRAHRIPFYEQLVARIRALPGVEAASLASELPGNRPMSFFYELEGAPAADPGNQPRVPALVVGAGYFGVMDARPMAGREFTESERVPAVMVNRSFADRFWPKANPVGKRLRLIEKGERQPWLAIVGVAPDIWQSDHLVRREFEPLLYLPFRQRPLPGMSVVARTNVPPETLTRAFRREVQAVDPTLPVYALRSLEEHIELHDLPLRLFGTMFTLFSAIAMFLASVGLYAVVAHSVNQRTREIGLRVAMGASPSDIVRSVFAEGMRQVLLGLGAGLAAAFALTRLLRGLLAGVLEPDAATFLAVPLVLLATGAMACLIPARRATRIDPATALRAE